MHLIDASHNVDSLWTTNKYSIIIDAPKTNTSILDYAIDGDGPKLSGSDGLVDIISGNRASAYYVQVGGRLFGGARKNPPPQYSTSYRSDLEGMKLTLEAVSETAATGGIEEYVGNHQTTESCR